MCRDVVRMLTLDDRKIPYDVPPHDILATSEVGFDDTAQSLTRGLDL
jgi:hypothetical protein